MQPRPPKKNTSASNLTLSLSFLFLWPPPRTTEGKKTNRSKRLSLLPLARRTPKRRSFLRLSKLAEIGIQPEMKPEMLEDYMADFTVGAVKGRGKGRGK